MLQEALEQEQSEALGRSRSERQPTPQGYRHGYEDGTVKTAEGVFRWQLPPVRGLREPYRSQLWAALGRTSDVLTRLIVEMDAGGMSQRAIASALEKARGQCVVSKSAVSELTDRLSHAYEALRTRDLSGFDIASVFMDTVYEPLRRWGSQTGILCAWGIGVDGRKGLLTRSTAHSESDDSCLEVVRDLVKRGLQTPVTMTTDGAPGLIKAMDAMWPQSLLAQYQATCPEACRCLEDAAEARLNHLKVPARHRQDVRTSNLAERAFAEERRRTKVMPPLWDDAS